MVITDKKPSNSPSMLLSVTFEEDEILKSRIKQGLVDLLVYGITGVGKTPLVASSIEIEELDKPVYIDIESGAHAAHQRNLEVIEFGLYVKKLLGKTVNGRKLGTEQDILFYIVEELGKSYSKYYIEHGEAPFNCLIFDGWTEAYEIIHSQAKLDGQGDKEVGTQNDRSRSFVRVKKLSRALRSIPVHILSTAREYTFTDDKGSVILERGPHLSGASMRYISAQPDIVARLRRVGTKLQLSVREDSVTIARDRFNLLPEKMSLETPSLKEVWKYLEKREKGGLKDN